MWLLTLLRIWLDIFTIFSYFFKNFFFILAFKQDILAKEMLQLFLVQFQKTVLSHSAVLLRRENHVPDHRDPLCSFYGNHSFTLLLFGYPKQEQRTQRTPKSIKKEQSLLLTDTLKPKNSLLDSEDFSSQLRMR